MTVTCSYRHAFQQNPLPPQACNVLQRGHVSERKVKQIGLEQSTNPVSSAPEGMGGVHDVQNPMTKGILTVLAPQGLAVIAEAHRVLAWGPCAVAIALHCARAQHIAAMARTLSGSCM